MTLAAERHALILAAVRRHGTVRLADLVEQLGVTAVTVRRDVTALADRGLVSRVHGGVTAPYRGEQHHQPQPGAHSPFGTTMPPPLVGMVVPSVEYYWPPVIQGAQSAIAAAGGRLVVRGSHYDPAEDRRQVAALLERGVHGLLAAPAVTGAAGRELLRWLDSLPVPIVLLERLPPPELPTLAFDAVTTAHALGAGLAVRHLVSLGHQRVALITSDFSPTRRALHEGWEDAVTSLELPDHSGLALEVPSYGAPDWPLTYDKAIAHCRGHGARALLVHSDREAIGIVERALDSGISVPDDLAVVSYDDVVAAVADPPLTAIRPETHRLGVTAAELALARLAEPLGRPVHRVQLWPTVVIRETCGGAGSGGTESAH